MQAVFGWLPDELNQKFEKHCENNNLTKIQVLRDALGEWLEQNGDINEPKREDSEMEANVSQSPLGEQSAA